MEPSPPGIYKRFEFLPAETVFLFFTGLLAQLVQSAALTEVV